MKELEEKILKDGKVLPGGILKVDNFLNHQMDPRLMYRMAEETKRLFEGTRVDRVLTIEASGIAFAIFVGYVLDCPVVFAKKHKSANISDNLYKTEIPSFTHGNVNTVVVSKEYLHAGESVLIVDDFMASGAAAKGLISLVEMAGSEVAGVVTSIEKVFQGGGNELRASGYRVEAMAKIAEMSDSGLSFC